ncbi:MAG: dioxygenase [Pseudomonadota bacterium]
MIIDGPDSVTQAVLSELEKADNPRFKEIMTSLVKHLHAFIREVKLTEDEFRNAGEIINSIGQNTNAYHNEAVLMSGSLGVSTLVCLLNNGNNGQTETTANLLGPFWRLDSPRTESGASIVRSPTPGDEMFVNAWVKDAKGNPVAGAEVDIWHSSTEGLYENQDPTQADMNLRGKFTTDKDGHFSFRSILPAGYPIPITGPVGDLLRAQGRHNMRPAHLHFLIFKEGFKTHISQVYVPQDPNIETDVQFGVTKALLGDYVRHDTGTPPAPGVKAPWYTLDYTFTMEAGKASLPRAPIHDKARSTEMRPQYLPAVHRSPSMAK